MLEYGIKNITTNPTLITRSTEVIRLVDSRNHTTRAFVIPAIYENELKEFFKKIEYKKWVEEKKEALKVVNEKKHYETEALSDELMSEGWKSIEDHLND